MKSRVITALLFLLRGASLHLPKGITPLESHKNFKNPLTLILLKCILNIIKEKVKRRFHKMQPLPEWLMSLDEEDLTFIKKFILASGSLKEIASGYGVTYPTVRLRLDRLIQKINLSESAETDPYVMLVKRLAINEKLDYETAKLLITEYRKRS